jgi:hypothetical protein
MRDSNDSDDWKFPGRGDALDFVNRTLPMSRMVKKILDRRTGDYVLWTVCSAEHIKSLTL